MKICAVSNKYLQSGKKTKEFKKNYYIFIHAQDSSFEYINSERITYPPHCCKIYTPNSKNYLQVECGNFCDYIFLEGNVEYFMKKYNLSLNTAYFPKNTEEISKCISFIADEFIQQNEFYCEICEAKTDEMLALIARECDENTHKTSRTIERSERLTIYNITREIVQNPVCSWTAKRVAEEMNISISSLRNKFKAFNGETVSSYIIDKRMNKAKELLEKSDYSIYEIAQRLEYSSQYYFIKQFKSKVGITPLEYRKKL